MPAEANTAPTKIARARTFIKLEVYIGRTRAIRRAASVADRVSPPAMRAVHWRPRRSPAAGRPHYIRHRIAAADPIQQARQQARQQQRRRPRSRQPCHQRHHRAAQNHRDHVARRRAQRHADSHLARPQSRRICDYAVHADAVSNTASPPAPRRSTPRSAAARWSSRSRRPSSPL